MSKRQIIGSRAQCWRCGSSEIYKGRCLSCGEDRSRAPLKIAVLAVLLLLF